MLAVDLSQLPLPVREAMAREFQTGWHMEELAARKRQQRAADEYHRHRPRALNGLGEQTMALDPFYDTWNRHLVGSVRWSQDRDLRKWYQKKFPETVVKSTGSKTMIGFSAPGPQTAAARSGQVIAVSGGSKRFTRVYA